MKLIAETAWHHEGDIAFMRDLAGNIADSAADVAKFHLSLNLDEYIDASHSLYEKYHQWRIPAEAWQEIIPLVSNKELMLLCNDTQAIEFAASFEPKIIEIHAVCMADLNMLDALKQNCTQGTKIALGISGNQLDAIDFSLDYLGHDNILLMYGFQNYPTQLQDVNLNKLRKIMGFYPHCEFGYADHCGHDEEFNEFVTLTGAALGVDYIEKHVTQQPGVKRIDYEAAIGFAAFNQLKSKLEQLEAMLGTGSLAFNAGERSYARLGTLKKAPLASRDLKQGEVLTRDAFVMKRCKSPWEFSPHEVIYKLGGKLTRDISAGSVINPLDIGSI